MATAVASYRHDGRITPLVYAFGERGRGVVVAVEFCEDPPPRLAIIGGILAASGHIDYVITAAEAFGPSNTTLLTVYGHVVGAPFTGRTIVVNTDHDFERVVDVDGHPPDRLATGMSRAIERGNRAAKGAPFDSYVNELAPYGRVVTVR